MFLELRLAYYIFGIRFPYFCKYFTVLLLFFSIANVRNRPSYFRFFARQLNKSFLFGDKYKFSFLSLIKIFRNFDYAKVTGIRK